LLALSIELSSSSNRLGRGNLKPAGGGPEGVALRGLEVWNCDAARRNGDDCRSRHCVVCGLATSRASGLVEEAILYTCLGGSEGRQETMEDLGTLKSGL
jgi:hypothetical protein